MKKLMLILFIWSCWVVTPIQSTAVTPAYIIYNDTHASNLDAIHDEILETAALLFQSADSDSYETLLQSGISRFGGSDRHAEYKNHTLMIVIGDGKGSIIKGDFAKNTFCLPEVKPKSIILEWLGV